MENMTWRERRHGRGEAAKDEAMVVKEILTRIGWFSKFELGLKGMGERGRGSR